MQKTPALQVARVMDLGCLAPVICQSGVNTPCSAVCVDACVHCSALSVCLSVCIVVPCVCLVVPHVCLCACIGCGEVKCACCAVIELSLPQAEKEQLAERERMKGNEVECAHNQFLTLPFLAHCFTQLILCRSSAPVGLRRLCGTTGAALPCTQLQRH